MLVAPHRKAWIVFKTSSHETVRLLNDDLAEMDPKAWMIATGYELQVNSLSWNVGNDRCLEAS